MLKIKNHIANVLWSQRELLLKIGCWQPLMQIYSRVRDWEELHDTIVLPELKAIYFPIPKVACSSIKSVCAQLLDLGGDKRGLDEGVHYINFSKATEKDLAGRYKNYFKFAFVRNPWDRIVSLYKNKMIIEPDTKKMQARQRFLQSLRKHRRFELGMSFEDFVEAIAQIPDVEAHDHFRSQYLFITDHHGNSLVDFIGRFENLEEDFANIMKMLNIHDIKLPRLMKSVKGDYREYYNDRTIKLIKNRYIEDITKFNYKY